MSKKSIEPLSQEWLNELESIEYSPEIAHRIRDLVALLHTADVLVDKYSSRKRLLSKMEPMELIAHYYFAHSYHLGLSIYHLCKLGFGNASLILVRALVEALIDFSYLWLCKEISGAGTDERAAWGNFGFVRRKNMENKWNDLQQHRDIKKLPRLDSILFSDIERKERLTYEVGNFKKDFKRNFWAKIKPLDQRARAVDDTQLLSVRTGIVLEQVYTTVYKYTSELVHGESASTNAYMRHESGGLNVDFGPSKYNIDLAIPMANEALLSILHIFNHVNNVRLTLIDQILLAGFTVPGSGNIV